MIRGFLIFCNQLPAKNHKSRAGQDCRNEAANRMVDARIVIAQVITAGEVDVVWSYRGINIKIMDGMITAKMDSSINTCSKYVKSIVYRWLLR